MFVIVRWFNSANDCAANEVNGLWWGHLLMTIEAFAIWILFTLILICVGIVAYLTYRNQNNQRGNAVRNRQIQNLLMGAANLQFNPNEINANDE